MAHHKSALKDIKRNAVRNRRNAPTRTRLKTELKRYYSFIEEGNTDASRDMLPQMYSLIDKAAALGIIKKNNAARKKSRLCKHLQKTASS